MKEWKSIIESAWGNRALLKEAKTQKCIRTIIEELDKGRLRTAEPTTDGWQVNDWVKKAVVNKDQDLVELIIIRLNTYF